MLASHESRCGALISPSLLIRATKPTQRRSWQALTAEALGSVYSKTGTTYTGKGAPHQLIGDGASY